MGVPLPDPPGAAADAARRRLRCGDGISLRLETPASVAGWGVVPDRGGSRGQGLLALLFVDGGAAADPPRPLPPLELWVGDHCTRGTTVVAAGPAADGAAVAWVHLPMSPVRCAAVLDGAPVRLRLGAGTGELPLEVTLPGDLASALVDELASGRVAGGALR
ncbi:MAG TPA: hypothetical protein VNN74_01190 [Candidatus Micrarchaeia archaeon]|nr:hypothetical protein [Candidatus Micrarchaeia archaeon]